MENIKVSVIIPVYNGAKFLEKNLLILSKQTLKEIEFILVNDSSTDNSMNILKAFKEIFPDKFVIINSDKNRGPGGARNIGLSHARGEYIGFMDQDDYCHPDMFKALYEEAVSDDFDIVKCGYYDKMNNKSSSPYDIKGELSDSDKRFYYSIDILFIWNKIYKKTLVDEMSMWFREKSTNDDTDFNIEICMRAKKVSSLPNIYYYWNFEGESASRNNVVNFKEYYASIENLFQSIEERNASTDNYDVGLKVKACVMITHIRRIMHFLFVKPDFSFKDFTVFDKFARKYLPEYYKLKDYNTLDMEKLIFNNLAENPKESYQNLIKFREKIESGAFDREIAEEKKAKNKTLQN